MIDHITVDSKIGFTNHEHMKLYYHATFRIYLLGAKLGLKKFDPFTLACYHSLIQIGYMFGIIGMLERNFKTFSYDKYILSLTLAVMLIGGNYMLIRKIGKDRLELKFFHQSKYVKSVLDLLIFLYVFGVFFFINYSRNLNGT